MDYRTLRLSRLLIAALALQASACIIISDDGTTEGTSSSTGTTANTSTSEATTDASTSEGSSAGTATDSTTAATTAATTDATTSSTSTTGESTTTGTTTGTTADTTTGGADPGFDPLNQGVQMCADPFANDPVDIMSAAIKGDVLFLDIGYGGGCQDHEFGLCWDGLFAESNPVQTDLVLGHDANGDACDAYMMEQKQLDLSNLKKAWQDAYQQQSGTIIIHLAAWANPIEYTF